MNNNKNIKNNNNVGKNNIYNNKYSTKYKNKLTRKQLLKKCGLPDILETAHCFADSTHHTCCMLGKQSREYADNSGNPIGQLSKRIYNSSNTIKKNYTKSKSHDLTPWCTCTGSQVCSFYSNKFGKQDKTHIKFIGNTKTKNEKAAITKLGLIKHSTPGIL